MDTLAFGKISNTGEGHTIETISHNKISIVFNQCNIDSSLKTISSFHDRCLKMLQDIINKKTDNHDYIFDTALRNIIHFIFINNLDGKLTLGVNAEIIPDRSYIRYTIIAPLYPEKFYLIEKV